MADTECGVDIGADPGSELRAGLRDRAVGRVHRRPALPVVLVAGEPVRMGPYPTWAVIVVIPLVLGCMAVAPDSESRFDPAMTGLIAVAVVAVSVVVTRRRRGAYRVHTRRDG